MSNFESRSRPSRRLRHTAATALAAALIAFAVPAATNAAPPTGYVGNAGSYSVMPFDVFTNVVAPAISASAPRAMAITPDGATVYVTSQNDDLVTPIDTATGVAGPTIPVGTLPVAIAIVPDGQTAYVANQGDGTVTPIDLATGIAQPAFAVGADPMGIAIAPDGETGYVANRTSDTVVAFDTDTHVLSPAMPIEDPTGIAIAPDGETAYVVQRVPDLVTPIDLASGVVGPPIAAGDWPNAIAIAPDGETAYVANYSVGSVTPIDLATNTAGTPIPAGSGPYSIAVTPDGKTVYTSNIASNDLTQFDTATGTPGPAIPVGDVPAALALAPAQAPVAAFTATDAGDGEASFDATASTYGYGPITRYEWDFGDGNTTTTATPTTTHVYASPGSYTATLTVTGAGGCSTELIFTGQTASCNGSPDARTERQLTVAEPVASGDQAAPAPATASKPARQAIERLSVTARCVRAGRGGQARVGLRLRLARPGSVRVRVERAFAARPGARCPKRDATRRYDGPLRDLETFDRLQTRAAAVDRRLTLQLRLEPGLYRISVRAHAGSGQLTRPARRWVRVLR